MKPTIGADNIHTYNVYHVFIAPTILIQTLEITVVTQAMASESSRNGTFRYSRALQIGGPRATKPTSEFVSSYPTKLAIR